MPAKKTKKNEEQQVTIAEAIKYLCKEKDISEEVIYTAIEDALKAAFRKNLPKGEIAPNSLSVVVSRTDGHATILARKLIVEDEELEDDVNQMTLEDAQKLNPTYQIGDICEVDVTPKGGFLRVAAQTAKQVIMQKIREAERGRIYDEYAEKENEILTAIVRSAEPGKAALLDLGRAEGILEPADMIPGETYNEGDHIKVYVLEMDRTRNTGYDTRIRVSRTHRSLVKRLFEMEVPEVAGGVVTIKEVAREAGSRTKMAVASSELMIDPVGACVGQGSSRVDRVVAELNGEKIDIIKWSADPAEFVANALSPANVLNIYTAEDGSKSCRVVVPDNHLSLAIGKGGQNARLAAKLTGWKIDIKSQSQAAEMTDMISDQQAEATLPENYETPFELEMPEADDDTL